MNNSLIINMNKTPITAIINVWNYNFQQEINHVISLVAKYPIITIDTEFPGIISYPSSYKQGYNYQLLRANVDRLKLIQLGFSLSDAQGNHPSYCQGWQFNFYFDLDHDSYSPDSLVLLEKAGIKFENHKNYGIDPEEFGSALTSSGIILENAYTWVCFHGFYDFGYMYKLVSGELMPESEEEFLEKLFMYFPRVFDVKYMGQLKGEVSGGLRKYAELYGILREGTEHQAGSDSLMTSRVFHLMVKSYKVTKCLNVIYGLGVSSQSCEIYFPREEDLTSLIKYDGRMMTKLYLSKQIEGKMSERTPKYGNVCKNSIEVEG